MGMANSAQAFQRLVDSVIGDLKDTFCYLDDILVWSKTPEDHQATLTELFTRLSKAGLSIAVSKCQFGVQEVDYLGYTISSSGMKPIAKKLEALKNFPPPTKQKEVLAFLGALNYYRSSLPKLSAEDSCDPEAPPSRTPAEVLDPLYKLATCNLEKKKDQFDSCQGKDKGLIVHIVFQVHRHHHQVQFVSQQQ